jgi:hypothetical protein
MKRIAKIGDREVWTHTLCRPYSLPVPPFGAEPYVAVISPNDATLTNDERNRLASDLVATNCRSTCATGIDASGWDDAVDWAYLDKKHPEWSGKSPVADADDLSDFVMTSWHDNKSPADVLHFAFNCTNLSDPPVIFTRYLMLFLGEPMTDDGAIIEELEKSLEFRDLTGAEG